MFDSYYPNSAQALFDEAVGVATVEVLSDGQLKSFTYVAGTKTVNSSLSVVVVLRYEHNPVVVTTPVVATYPKLKTTGIGGIISPHKARCMAVHVDPVHPDEVRVVVAAETLGLQGTKDIKVVAFDRDLDLVWTNTYSWDGGFNPPWQGDDVPVAMDIGLNVVAVVGTSQSNPGTGMGTDMVTLCYRHSDGMGAMPAQRFATVNNDAAIDVEVTGFPLPAVDLVFALGQVTDNTTGLRAFATTVYPTLEFPPTPVTYYSGVSGWDNVPVGIAYNGQVGSAMRIAVGGTTYPAPGQPGDADYFTQAFDVVTPAPPLQTYLLSSRWLRQDDGGVANDVMGDIEMVSTVGQAEGSSTSWVWVTGKSDHGANGKAIWTQQFDDNLAGSRTWEAKWNRPGNTGSYHDDEGIRLTPLVRTGRKDSVYVAGRTQNDSGNWDLVALRYSQTAQNPKLLIWNSGAATEAPIYASLANGDDIPAGISAHHIFPVSQLERIFFGLGGRSFATPSDFDLITTVFEDFHTSDLP